MSRTNSKPNSLEHRLGQVADFNERTRSKNMERDASKRSSRIMPSMPTYFPARSGSKERASQDAGEDGSSSSSCVVTFVESIVGSQAPEKTTNPLFRPSMSYDICVDLSRKHHLHLSDVRAMRNEFSEFDIDANGSLSLVEFKNGIRKRCCLDDDAEIPPHLLSKNWESADVNSDGKIDFEEYVLWSSNHGFAEEIACPDAEVRQLRQVAREHKLELPIVERVKRVFDRFDRDGSGQIEENEFKNCLITLMRVSNPEDVSELALRRYWREVDVDRSGSISFSEFVVWYFAVFGGL
jgi:Ca2+-binding EF-hand superfamily protein